MAWRMLDGRFEWRSRRHFDRAKLIRMLLINRDIMLRTAALITVFLVFSSQGARDGDLTLAANAVLQNLMLVGSFFLEGLANAAQQLCGASYGARDRASFSRAVRLLLLWSAAFGIAVSVVFYLGGRPVIDLMTASEDVRRVAYAYLPLAALAPALGALAFCFDGIYVGATWTRDMRNMMTAAMASYLAVWWATASLGNTGLWIALLTFYVFRSSLLGLRYRWLIRADWPPR
jgi:MATE family multidrug resistance protein